MSWVLIISRSENGVFSVSLKPLRLLFLLTGPTFLFDLCGLWVLMPQTGAPLLLTVLLLTVLLLRENLLFRDTERELQGVWRKGERSRGYFLDIRVGINSKLKLESLVNT